MRTKIPILFGTLLLVLAACTTPPITIGLSDITLDFQAVGNTLGQVVFPGNPLAQQRSVEGVSVASIRIQGQARLENKASLKFYIYAADQDPAELNCTELPALGYYLCPASTEGIVRVGTIDFTTAGGPTKGPVAFELSDEEQILSNGINKQSLYLGAQVDGTFSVNNVLYLENLVATVQLNIGK